MFRVSCIYPWSYIKGSTTKKHVVVIVNIPLPLQSGGSIQII